MSELRQRATATAATGDPGEVPDAEQELKEKEKDEEVVWGRTPGGEVFRVPTTHDVLTALFHPSYPKSHIDAATLSLLGAQLLLFALLPRAHARVFFLAYFAFWRAAYDAGLGWVLTQQSTRRWVVRAVQRRGWLDAARRPKTRAWIRRQLAGKMGKDYEFDDLPLEYNTWLLFRQLVDLILLNDFVAYCMFAFACFRVPTALPPALHAARWAGGLALIAFNAWVKAEAHAVVRDYGWYWGDVFFARGALVFDGVFELAPHPMYSVGYAGYYGLSLLSGSYAVLFVSLAAHAAQFAFLVCFENPHIERAYGQRKLLAQRTPLARPAATPAATPAAAGGDTPSATDGDTGTESDAPETEPETETETERAPRPSAPKRRALASQHDLLAFYFRKDTLGLRNFDAFRAADFQLLLLLIYAVGLAVLPAPGAPRAFFAHALGWTLFNTFGLGLLLRAQGERKALVRHFVQHYHYPAQDGARGAVREAFANWKQLYNTSMCMTYVSAFGLAWKTYTLPETWITGNALLMHTFGVLLIGLHVWASHESYQVLGVFGWFFGDFFMEQLPAHLDYTGIYRYLNNPEILSGAAFFGLALITRSKLVFVLAGIKHVSHWWFLRYVEHPHMRKLYGDSLRKDAGFVKVLKKVARSHASRAGRHAPALTSVAREVKGTLDKVYEETAEAVEDFLAKSRPRFDEVVQDTKFLLQQSRERLVITRVAHDVSSIDATAYALTIPGATPRRFHLGEPIRAVWRAPPSHSRKDWVGLYRVGANGSRLVTKTSSRGMWVPVHGEEWDGDFPLARERADAPPGDGEVVFVGETLPWAVGTYELRYHHDGKYNVLAIAGPFEVYVERPARLDFASVRAALLRIVPLCLDSDPSLLPLSARPGAAAAEPERDPDDFRFWSERQARRIAGAIAQAFGVEYAPEVVLADANVSALANRILVSTEVLSPA